MGARPAGGRMQLRGLERWISLLRLIAFPFVFAAVAFAELPAGLGAVGVGDDRRVLRRLVRVLPARPKRARCPPPVLAKPRRADLRHGDRHLVRDGLRLRARPPRPADPLHRPGRGLRPVRDHRRPDPCRGVGSDPCRLRRPARQPPAPGLHLEARRVPDRARGADGADRRLARPAARRGGIAGRGAGRGSGAAPPGRAEDRRRAAPALDPAGRLRLARLARGTHADGGGDRLGAHAPAALARPDERAARRLPRPDRGRDRPARRARRGGARHLAYRLRNVQLHFGEVELAGLVNETVATAELARESVHITASVPPTFRSSSATPPGCVRFSPT